MSIKDLEKEGLIRRLPIDKIKVKDSFRLAERDIKTSRGLIKEDPDWAFSIAYNAILQAGRALMFSHGYRPVGKAQHVSVIRFVETSLSHEVSKAVTTFDMMRRKRHRAVYDTAGSISTLEAKNAITRAEELLEKIRTKLKENGFLEK
ncbi:HEPN domain protein [archaeon BMS3Abin16]|nr:HEPN domain protein [archaeon BMS3Abin16]GBE56613.1 HEPN domain protein [archaeon BMS3Bbin16]